MNPLNGGWLIPATLVAAMVLAIARLPGDPPQWLVWLRPEWALATLFCWTVAAPARTGVATAWLAGLFFDALLGASHPFGLHGACFAFAVFVAGALNERLRMYNVVQQAAVVFAVVLAAQLFKMLARGAVTDHVEWSPLVALPALTTMLVYPGIAAAVQPLADRFLR